MHTPPPPHTLDPVHDPDATPTTVPRYPAPLDPDRIPSHFADNPLVALYLRLTPEEEASLARSAASDAEDDATVAAALVANAR